MLFVMWAYQNRFQAIESCPEHNRGFVWMRPGSVKHRLFPLFRLEHVTIDSRHRCTRTETNFFAANFSEFRQLLTTDSTVNSNSETSGFSLNPGGYARHTLYFNHHTENFIVNESQPFFVVDL